MPKVRFRDYYQYPESFDELRDEDLDERSTSGTKPFFRRKKFRQKDHRRERNSRHDDEKDLY